MESRELAKELGKLKVELMEMAAHVERNISDSIAALIERDANQLAGIAGRDPEVDLMEIQIDRACHHLLVRFRPVGSDLRFLAIALKLVKDLERVGDLAVDIAKYASMMIHEVPPKEVVDVSTMARIALRMLTQSLDAIVRGDLEQANQVIKDDDEVDRLHDLIFKELSDLMKNDPTKISQSVCLLYINNFVERIGDHSSNIAEMVIFMIAGKDVRHLEKIKPLREKSN